MSGPINEPRTVVICGKAMVFSSVAELAAMATIHIGMLKIMEGKIAEGPVSQVKWGKVAETAESLAAICRAQQGWNADHTSTLAGTDARRASDCCGGWPMMHSPAGPREGCRE